MSQYIGTRVNVPGTSGHGIIRYVGAIEGKMGAFAGIELIGPIAATRGKNSGAVDGKQYFEVTYPMTGLFLPFERVKSVNQNMQFRIGEDKKVLFGGGGGGGARSDENRGHGLDKNSKVAYMDQKRPFSPSRKALEETRNPSLLENKINMMRQQDKKGKAMASAAKDSSRTTLDQDQVESLKLEFAKIKLRYEDSQHLLSEQASILEDLRGTVNEVQPLLEEYEKDAIDKDHKLRRQEEEFHAAREEWRESLELVSSAQQDSEIFYEKKIAQLEEQLKNAHRTPLPPIQDGPGASYEATKKLEQFTADISSKDETIQALMKKIETLEQENSDFVAKIENLESNANGVSQDLVKAVEERDTLEKKFENLVLKHEELKMQKHEPEKEIGTRISRDFGAVNLGTLKSSSKDSANDHLPILLENVIEELTNRQITSQTKSLWLESSKVKNLVSELASLQAKLENGDDKSPQSPLQPESSKASANNNINPEFISSSDSGPANETTTRSELPIYKPVEPVDPSKGKDLWCGLCERSDHNSLNCPYENDMF